ncbi:MAG: hypothetical protein ACYCTI_01605 [Acidimicrobiales bacterium]
MISKAAVRWVLVLSAVVPVMAAGTPAWAAKPAKAGGGGTTSSTTGIDVSWPQCPGTSLPSGEAFAIVGVNGGVANDYNPCLSAEVTYAAGSPGVSGQPGAQLYVNTADPGNSVGDWPYGSDGGGLGAYGSVSLSGTDPYGSCTTTTTTENAACAYVYGYNMVAGAGASTPVMGDVAYLKHETGDAASSYQWWLDVETGNTWQADQTMNIADLQGMVAALGQAGVGYVGVYSTSSQWGQITGTPGQTNANGSGTSITNTLWGLADWIPGARSAKGAASNCSLASFTNTGTPAITQWFGHPYDGDYACTA